MQQRQERKRELLQSLGVKKKPSKDTDRQEQKRLQKRLHCKQLYLRCLEHFIADPSTVDAEISRHHEQIKKHEAAIQLLVLQRDDAPRLLEKANADIKRIEEAMNKLLLKKYLEEYLSLLGKLED